jgi:crotonobetainyl-CoA:carnitine CoA-transferase CaiB-like acyl-CoA transferase
MSQPSTTTTPAPAALAGVRVLDLSGGTAGAVAGMLLGDFGASVLRANPASGGHVDPAGEVVWHRNNTCTDVDWADAAQLERVHAFLASADVCITSDTRTERALGIDGESARARSNPTLVHLSLPSWPSLAAGPYGGVELDAFIGAISGLAARQSSFDGGPIDFVYPHIQYVQGLWGATVGLAALIERERSGLGQKVEVDGVQGATLTGTAIMAIDPVEPPKDTNVGAGGPSPIYSKYQCADGEWLFFAALMPKFQDTGFAVLGVADILSDERILEEGAKGADGGSSRAPAPMRTRLYAPENRDWLRDRIAGAFATRPRDEWLELLERGDCPAAAIGDRDDWLDHPQMLALGQRKHVQDPKVGSVVMAGNPAHLLRAPAKDPSGRRFVPLADIPLWEPPAAASPSPSESLPDRAGADGEGPLSGVRVIDLGTVLAGPLAGMLLATLGAEVIKVEPPSGDAFRMTGWHYNRGQRSVAVDLLDPVGSECFRSLVATTDVVIDNYRPGVLERLGIDYDSLCKVQPDVVSVSISAFGHVGPLTNRPGFDPLLQAMSGMMKAQGGADEPVFYTVAVNDIAAATAAAFGACVALYRRARTGEGDQVRTSLAASSAFMQCAELARFEGRPPAAVGGRDFRGAGPRTRFYRAADGWVRVHAADLQQLQRSGLLPSAAPEDDDECIAALSAAIATRRRDDVLDALAGAGITAVPVRTVVEFVTDEQMLAERYIESLPNGERSVHLPGPYARFSRTQAPAMCRPPGVGEHTGELLLGAGVAADALERAVADGVVAVGDPLTILPLIDYR